MTNAEIQVGEYIRTESGYIGKVTEILSGAVAPRVQTELKAVSTIMVIKHSFNLIDLIEVGDFVNGHLVVGFNEEVDINGYKYKEIEIESDYLINHYLKSEDIKSIVTKEKFKSVEYEMGSE